MVSVIFVQQKKDIKTQNTYNLKTQELTLTRLDGGNAVKHSFHVDKIKKIWGIGELHSVVMFKDCNCKIVVAETGSLIGLMLDKHPNVKNFEVEMLKGGNDENFENALFVLSDIVTKNSIYKK